MPLPTPEQFAAEVEALAPELAQRLGASAVVAMGVSGTYKVGAVFGVQWNIAEVASFQLAQMPGCSGVVTMYHVKVAEPCQGRGVGKLVQQLAARVACAAGYGLMTATTLADDARQRHILLNLGWDVAETFTNTATGHRVALWRHAPRRGA
jgi:GNAT superfamily N-acetyltransferase